MKYLNTMPWMRINYNVPGDPAGGTPPAAPPAGGAPITPPALAPTPGGTPPADPAFPTLKPVHEGTPPGGTPPGGTPPVDPNAPPALPYADFVGPPAEGKYADFTPVEGQTIDTALVAKFAPIANELGLSQKGAQRLADFYAKEIVGPQSATFVEQIATWFGETQADKEIGGDKFEASTISATKALDVFGTSGLKKILVQYGLGNHPEFVRFFTRVGRAIGEDAATGGKGGQAATPVDFLTQMYGPAKT